MAILDEPAPDAAPEITGEAIDSRARANRQLIGVLLTAYGALEGALLGYMALFARQASDGTEPLLVPALLVLSIPCCLTLVGLALARDGRWGYWAALFLPIVIVPVAAWWIMNPHRRPERYWIVVFGPLGGGAFLALGAVGLSAALLVTQRRSAAATCD